MNKSLLEVRVGQDVPPTRPIIWVLHKHNRQEFLGIGLELFRVLLRVLIDDIIHCLVIVHYLKGEEPADQLIAQDPQTPHIGLTVVTSIRQHLRTEVGRTSAESPPRLGKTLLIHC